VNESVYEVAAKALKALRRRALPAEPRVQVVSGYCKICGKTHRMGLESPRCAGLAPMVPISRQNPAFDPIFGRVLAMALLAGCMTLSGCALAPKVDANYRGRVDSFSMPIGIIWTGTVLTIGLAPAWHYRLPTGATLTSSTLTLQHTIK
jgi:hypothetical protein